MVLLTGWNSIEWLDLDRSWSWGFLFAPCRWSCSPLPDVEAAAAAADDARASEVAEDRFVQVLVGMWYSNRPE